MSRGWQFSTKYCMSLLVRVSGFLSKLSNLSGNFFPQSLGQLNDSCKFSEFSEAVYCSPGAWTKWIWPLYQWKKNCSHYGVHGIQIDRLGLTVPTQKSVLKNMYRVPRYYQKSAQNRSTKPNQQKLTHFGWYLRTRCIFFKTDFCIEIVSLSRSIWIPWTP